MSQSKLLIRSCLLGGVCLSLARGVLAQEPTCAGTCPRNFSCEVAEICGSAPEFGEAPEACSTHAVCTALPCSSDADCDADMRCYEEADSDEPATCAPRWLLGCNEAADCGAGFTCAEELPCLDPTAEGAATCEPEGVNVCYIHSQSCQADSDCIAGWTCENNPLNAYWSNTSGEMGCNIVDPALICTPPFAKVYGLGPGYLDWQTGVEWSHRSVPVAECPAPIERGNDFVLASSYGSIVDGRVTTYPQGVDSTPEPAASPATDPGDVATPVNTPATPMLSSGSEGGCSVRQSGAGVDGARAGLFGFAAMLSIFARRLRARR
jgi:hypothetical protein